VPNLPKNDDEGMVQGINITPLVDITLVLLIIFIVTTKVTIMAGTGGTTGTDANVVPMDLPATRRSNSQDAVLPRLWVELRADGSAYVNYERVDDDDAILTLARGAYSRNFELSAVIRADDSASHGRVIHVLGLLRAAGIRQVSFAMPQSERPGAAPLETPPPYPR